MPVHLKTLIKNMVSCQTAVAAMAHTPRTRQGATARRGKKWIRGWRRCTAARNKRNLTWRSAHFLNGMFPLPLTDIMHRPWITSEKSPIAVPFRPSVFSKTFVMRFSLFTPFCRHRAPARSISRNTLCVVYHTERISTVSFSRFPHADPFQSRLTSPARWRVCWIIFATLAAQFA